MFAIITHVAILKPIKIMNAHADETQKNKSQSFTNELSQKQSCGESTFQFTDNRPKALAQSKFQKIANNSPQGRIKPTIQRKGQLGVNDGSVSEPESDVFGGRALNQAASNHVNTIDAAESMLAVPTVSRSIIQCVNLADADELNAIIAVIQPLSSYGLSVNIEDEIRAYIASRNDPQLVELSNAVSVVDNYIATHEEEIEVPEADMEEAEDVLTLDNHRENLNLTRARLLYSVVTGKATASQIVNAEDSLHPTIVEFGNEDIQNLAEDSVISGEDHVATMRQKLSLMGAASLQPLVEQAAAGYGTILQYAFQDWLVSRLELEVRRAEVRAFWLAVKRVEVAARAAPIDDVEGDELTQRILSRQAGLMARVVLFNNPVATITEIPNETHREAITDSNAEALQGELGDYISDTERVAHEAAMEVNVQNRDFLINVIHEGLASENRLISNTCEWLESRRTSVFALSPTHDSERSAALFNFVKYFPNPQNDSGDIYSGQVPYDINDEKTFLSRGVDVRGLAGEERYIAILSPQGQTADDLLRILVHETQHLADMHDDDALSRYQSEFNAYMTSVVIGDPMPFIGNAEARFEQRKGYYADDGDFDWEPVQLAIFSHLMRSGSYQYLIRAWADDNDGFRNKVIAIKAPLSGNLQNSIRIDNLLKAARGDSADSIAARIDALDVQDLEDIQANQNFIGQLNALLHKRFPRLNENENVAAMNEIEGLIRRGETKNFRAKAAKIALGGVVAIGLVVVGGFYLYTRFLH